MREKGKDLYASRCVYILNRSPEYADQFEYRQRDSRHEPIIGPAKWNTRRYQL
ncbi:MAG: hypothetical protein HY518_02455 [Candidatus Aenigmarchaeota archaeon]|nr:hypothetical protein [Candidatus Aenigmarchaeota archaeon]